MLINVTNLTFSYEGSYDNIFENVSFSIDTDWKLGLVGRNGRGKTTFLRLLKGDYEYVGNISGGVDFEYFPYEVEDISVNTIDVVDRINHMYEYWQLQRELSLLDVLEDVLYRPFESLSNGERTKVLIATMFLKENKFLLIDEPTNHLDTEGRKKLAQYLKSKKGYILVSHDRAFIDECVDHILSLNKLNIDVQKGSFSSWWENKENRDRANEEENRKLKKEIKRLSEASKRTDNWSNKVEKSKRGAADKGFVGHKAAKMMKTSKNIEARQNMMIEDKRDLLKNIELVDTLKLQAETYHSNLLITAKDLSVSYGAYSVFCDLSFDIFNGDKVVIQGKNGTGKSTVLKLISGCDISYSGAFQMGSGIKVSYVPQDTSFLPGDLSVFAEERKIDESLFKTILRKFDFSREQFDICMSSYSAGQKKKVLIAASLCEKAHLYLWDEPLNFIDVFSRMQIENMLKDSAMTFAFVEHDSSFCDNVATKKIVL